MTQTTVKTNSQGEYLCFHFRKQYHWAAEYTDLEEEQQGHLHDSVGTEKDKKDEKDNIKGVIFFENQQNTKNSEALEPKKVYLDIYYKYDKLMEEKYATQIQKYKIMICGE